MWLRTLFMVVSTVALLVSANTLEDTTTPQPQNVSRWADVKPCCLAQNVYSVGKCEGKDDTFLLDCENNMFSLEAFFINNKSELFMGSAETGPPEKQFCTVHFRNQSTVTTIALLCFPEQPSITTPLFIVKGCLALLSALFLLATLYVYYIIPDLRETQDKVTINTLCFMLVFFVSLGILQLFPTTGLLCNINAFLGYFSLMAYFAWMNLVMLNVWKNSVCHRWQIGERSWYAWNKVYGWAVPIVLVINLLVQNEDHFGYQSCWVNTGRSHWLLVYLPMSVMLFVNVLLFAWSAWAIHMSGQDVSADRKRALAYKLKLYVRLVVLAGLTWILEFLSSYFKSDNNHNNHPPFSYWMLVDAINILLGLFVFLVLIVWRPRIRKELAGKRILCFYVPDQWANGGQTDEDCLQQTDHEIIKQSNSLI